jgi:tetratricopeptide (TPR) repeat protein
VSAVIASVLGGFLLLSGKKGSAKYNSRDLVSQWKSGDYRTVFDISEKELEKKPLDYFFLMMHGFSAYQLALSQINNSDMLAYIDRAIWALRKAMQTERGKKDARIKYALGKSYFYKGHKYSDLCIQYLEEAKELNYKANDMAQFLGLSYAQIHDYRRSIEAFSEALQNEDALDADELAEGEDSDLLLLAIARSYIELGDGETARPYIMRTIEVSRDFNTISAARLMFAVVLRNSGEYDSAESQIMAVIKEGGDTAEAHFELGELYNAKNDYYRARSEWRQSTRLDPNYAPARARLST